MIETLSAPQLNKSLKSFIFFTPPPTVKGIKHDSAVLDITSNIALLFSVVAEISKKQISSAPILLYNFACSAGSQASRKFIKLIPLTVRPSCTSKQAITLVERIIFNSFLKSLALQQM